MGEENSSKTRWRVFLVAAINVLTIGFLIWTLRYFKLGELVDDLQSMNWWWVALAIAADIGVYSLQAWRWRFLLRPVEPVSFRQTLGAVYVGLFWNEALGFNAGEVVRPYLLTNWTKVPFSVSISSVLIERIFDGIWLFGCLMIALRLESMPIRMRHLLEGSEFAIGVFALLGGLLLAVAFFHPHRARSALSDKNWQRHLRVLIDDLSLIGHSRYLYWAFFVSLAYLVMQSLPVYATFKGYGFDGLGIPDAFAMMVMIRVGSAVPAAPGNSFLYLTAMETMKKMFGATDRDSQHFSMVLWGILTLRLVIGGIVALAITGARIGQLRRAAHEHRAEHERSRA